MADQRVKRRRFIKQIAGTWVLGAGYGLDLNAVSNRAPSRPAKNIGALCVFSKHLQFLDFSEMAQLVAKTGFEGVDLTVRPGGHVEPERVEVDLPRAVDAIQKAGLVVPMITTAITDANADARRILTKAAELGIEHYRLGYYKYDPSLGIIASLDSHKPKLSRLVELNESLGIVGNYQNHAGPYVGAPIWDLYLLMKDLDPRWIGCQYDIRHAAVEGGRSWDYGLELMQDYIKTLAVKDFSWSREDGRWVDLIEPLGKGMVDFPAFLSKIKELGIGGPVTVHFEYPFEYDILEVANAQTHQKKVAEAMESDLSTLKKFLEQAGISRE